MSSRGWERSYARPLRQEKPVTQLLKVQNFTVSSDGVGAGGDQTLERPFGHVDPGQLMGWAFSTASWPNRADGGGTRGLDDCMVRDFHHNIGAEIMGRNKFGPVRGPWEDEDWQGWWGEEPPFHTPVFVLTHHPRPSFSLSDTTFHFVGGRAGRRPGPGSRGGGRQGRPARRRGQHDPPVPRRRPGRHAARGGRADHHRVRAAAVGLPRRPARPVPPRRRPQPERRDAPPLLAALSRPSARHARACPGTTRPVS